MTEKVLCPFCGGDMELHLDAFADGYISGAAYYCTNCDANAPYIDYGANDSREAVAARALQAALRRPE